MSFFHPRASKKNAFPRMCFRRMRDVSASMDSQHLGFASMDSHLSTATNLPDPFCLGVKKTKTCLRSVEISGLIAAMLF